ncbi:hypothetical protein GCM10011490_06780 [Pseudoclavibacter endophyticus]|uniref:Uncharacterized protein n=1 Tax=Pseudoclavibacter endophyticus TaxID=1778590 RepID=A0A6H9WT24_9MICO|nr:hypothetical protein [Pseudoclavibacter endophyticus]KAB1649835.1 hypothetical protein F8O04_06295 [Pseudoclavibacter endophyticus]GGA59409.1 hypothetical protein GCM10011490_06780 [Pseudoclavibacter endophyticus]
MNETIYPWPTIQCANCPRVLAPEGAFLTLDTGANVCVPCLETFKHSEKWPDCPEEWHDAYDHLNYEDTE